ncbi:GNAT family N-acetyltransferase [Candidatus Rhabdochlamydia porcellionis]|jgi:ribosomal protein S18 acetylase RimI-like enzyme|uniref:Acetyltransferase (GNAT) family n=1 Tax=Candidatus Rhabdochlamydia porcellionis TaxID=225148 RepID=A0ABX8Z3M3_9BACT|nr:GNAT family N-acetyltransferase [Candidatus Rhabdochlamydia porcellionis]QZA59132.1 Acetyltransferase (GNAT) family [Candidatus Rhabdochlamydia porcellionis]
MNRKRKTFSNLNFRLTDLSDAPYLTKWLSDPEVLHWFPMLTQPEVADAIRIWIGYSRFGSGITVEHNNMPCGMATLYIQAYEKLKHTCLFSIIIQKDKRGYGIGHLLMEKLMKLAEEKFKIDILHLEVYEGNPACKMYAKLGFVEFGRQEKFIKEKNTYLAKVFMQKRLI